MDRREVVVNPVCAGCIAFEPAGSDKVVLIKGHCDDPDFCSFPKGMQENGNTLKETATLEMRQETGLSSTGDLREVGVTRYSRVYQDVVTQKEVHWFVSEIDPNFPVSERDGECNAVLVVGWVTALGLLTFDSDKEMLLKAAALRYETEEL